MELEEQPQRIYLLSIPRLPKPQEGPLVAGLMFPFIVILMAVVLVPRLILIALLLVGRVVRVAAYNGFAKAGILAVLTFIPSIILFGLVSFVIMLPCTVLLQWNLALSGMDLEDRMDYVNFLVGPVIGTRD